MPRRVVWRYDIESVEKDGVLKVVIMMYAEFQGQMVLASMWDCGEVARENALALVTEMITILSTEPAKLTDLPTDTSKVM